MLPLVSLHDELMGASNKVKAVNVSELFGYVLTESVTSATRRNTPTAPLIGIRPEQVADGTLVRRLLHAIELANLVEGVDAGRETTVKAED